jgi:Ca2+-binding RTX toxin-like protein
MTMRDRFVRVEALQGTRFADWLGGDAADNVLDGGKGADTLAGGAGADSLEGGAGNDLIDGGAGDDRLAGGLGNDIYVVDAAGDLAEQVGLGCLVACGDE